MKCANCGAEVSDRAAFCPECGTPLQVTAPVEEAVPVEEAAPAEEAPVNAAADEAQSAVGAQQTTYSQPNPGAQQTAYSQAYGGAQQTYGTFNQSYTGSAQQTTYSQSYSNAQQSGQQYAQSQKKTTPPISIVGLVLGILSILCCCSAFGGLMFGIPGVILSVMGNKNTKTGIGTAGMICSIIGIVLSVFMLIYSFFVLGGLSASDWEDLYRSYYYGTYY